MRILKKTIYLAVILIIIILVVLYNYDNFHQWLTATTKDSTNPSNTKVYITYKLKQKKWTSFPIDVVAKSLLVRTNAEYYKTNDPVVNYAIQFEILDSRNNVLMKQHYFMKNETILYRKKRSSRILSNPFLLKGMNYITSNSSFIIPLTDLKKPAAIRMKWTTIADVKNVTGVLIRVSSDSSMSNARKNIIWYRISPESKKGLTSGNFYPVHMVNSKEKKNIINNMWSPIGPTGKSFISKRICTIPYIDLRPIKLDVNDNPDDQKKKSTSELFNLYLNSGKGGFYKPPSTKEIVTATELFERIFKGEAIKSMKDDWHSLGMNITQIKRGTKTFIVIHEEPNKLVGHGFYVFCKGSETRNIVLEMPHRYFDTKTGIIGYKLMLSGYFAAASWNTVHRYQTPNDTPTSSDMAHVTNSYFNAFTKAFASSMVKKSILIQLHGFSNKKQPSKLGKAAAVVLSEGTNTPSWRFLSLAGKLKKAMPSPVYIYPEDKIRSLAALNNVSAEDILISAKKDQVFMHFEMNVKTRSQMVKNKSLRKKFIDSLITRTIKLYPALSHE